MTTERFFVLMTLAIRDHDGEVRAGIIRCDHDGEVRAGIIAASDPSASYIAR